MIGGLIPLLSLVLLAQHKIEDRKQRGVAAVEFM